MDRLQNTKISNFIKVFWDNAHLTCRIMCWNDCAVYSPEFFKRLSWLIVLNFEMRSWIICWNDLAGWVPQIFNRRVEKCVQMNMLIVEEKSLLKWLSYILSIGLEEFHIHSISTIFNRIEERMYWNEWSG